MALIYFLCPTFSLFLFFYTPTHTPISGLGYIVGSAVDKQAKDWHWALRVSPQAHYVSLALLFWCDIHTFYWLVMNTFMPLSVSLHQVTPALGLLAVVLLLCVVKEPKRGAIEARPEHTLHRTSWLSDMKALFRKSVLFWFYNLHDFFFKFHTLKFLLKSIHCLGGRPSYPEISIACPLTSVYI